MQQWEYLEVLCGIGSGLWTDSAGRTGKLTELKVGSLPGWLSSSGLLNELGTQGWELVSGVWPGTGLGYRLLFRRLKQRAAAGRKAAASAAA